MTAAALRGMLCTSAAAMGPIIQLTETARCTLREATGQDQAAVADLFEDLADVMRLLGPEQPAHSMASEFLDKVVLPPGGAPEYARASIIEHARERELLGVMEHYCGYPTAECLYIGSLFLGTRHQRSGYGTELEEALGQLARAAGYRFLYVGVGLLNWPALRFWIARGYREVTKLSGPVRYASGSFAIIELRRALSEL